MENQNDRRRKRKIMVDHQKTDRIRTHDDLAGEYDSLVEQYHSHTHDVLFGMCYEYLNPGEALLDVGIGTGLSSLQFASAGLEIFGMDASESMLRECRKKGFVRELKEHDMTNLPWPYDNETFSHVISCGVLHFFGKLDSIFAEVSRVLRPGGLFAFTVAMLSQQKCDNYGEEISSYLEMPTRWDTSIFKHSSAYIGYLVQAISFSILKEQKILTMSDEAGGEDLLLTVLVTRRGS